VSRLRDITEEARQATVQLRALEADGRALCWHCRVTAICPQCSEAWRCAVQAAQDEAERLHGERLKIEAHGDGWAFPRVTTGLLWLASAATLALWLYALTAMEG